MNYCLHLNELEIIDILLMIFLSQIYVNYYVALKVFLNYSIYLDLLCIIVCCYCLILVKQYFQCCDAQWRVEMIVYCSFFYRLPTIYFIITNLRKILHCFSSKHLIILLFLAFCLRLTYVRILF